VKLVSEIARPPAFHGSGNGVLPWRNAQLFSDGSALQSIERHLVVGVPSGAKGQD